MAGIGEVGNSRSFRHFMNHHWPLQMTESSKLLKRLRQEASKLNARLGNVVSSCFKTVMNWQGYRSVLDDSLSVHTVLI